MLPADAPLLLRLDSDPAVMRFVSGGEPTPAATIVDWVIPRSQSHFQRHGTGLWAGFDRRTDRFVGWVRLRAPRHSATAELELSYRLQRAAWGRGLATEAAGAVIAAAFDGGVASRIFASTHPDNAASQRVMQKLGMRLAPGGLLREQFDREQFDEAFTAADIEYEILRTDWLRRLGTAPVAGGRHHWRPGPDRPGVPA